MYQATLMFVIGLVLVFIDAHHLFPAKPGEEWIWQMAIYAPFAIACCYAALAGWFEGAKREAQTKREIEQALRRSFFDFDDVWCTRESTGTGDHVNTSTSTSKA